MSYFISISHNVHSSLQLRFKGHLSSKIDFDLKPAKILQNVPSPVMTKPFKSVLAKSYTDIDEIIYRCRWI